MHEKEKAYHRILAEYFEKTPAYLDSDRKRPNRRRCIELPRQQRLAGMWVEAVARITDIDFLQAKALAGYTQDLLQDLQATMTGHPEDIEAAAVVQALWKALRARIQLVETHPDTLLSLLYGPLSEVAGAAVPGLAKVLASWAGSMTKPWFKSLLSSPRHDLAGLLMRDEATTVEYGMVRAPVSLHYAPDAHLLAALSTPESHTAAARESPPPRVTVWDVRTFTRVRVSSVLNTSPLTLSVPRDDSVVQFSAGERAPKAQELWGHFQSPSGKYQLRVRSHEVALNDGLPPSRFLDLADGTGRHLATWRPHAAMLADLCFLDHPTRFATGSTLGEVAIWDVSALLDPEQKPQDLGFHSTSIQSIAVSLRGDRAISVGLNDCVVWDLQARKSLFKRQLSSYGKCWLQHASFVGASHQTLMVDRKGAGYLLLDTTNNQLSRVKFSREEMKSPELCAVASSSGQSLWWDDDLLPPGLFLVPGQPGERAAQESDFVDGCRFALRGAYEFRRPVFGEAVSGTALVRVVVAAGERGRYGLAFAAAASRDQYLPLAYDGGLHFTWASGSVVDLVGADGAGIGCHPSVRVAMSLDGSRVIIGDFTGTLRACGLEDWSEETRARASASNTRYGAHEGAVLACCIRADGKYAVSIGSDCVLCLWNLSSNDLAAQTPVARTVIEVMPSACAFAQDGSIVAVGMRGGSVQIFSVENLERASVPSLEQCADQELSVIAAALTKHTDLITSVDDGRILKKIWQSAASPQSKARAVGRAAKLLTTDSFRQIHCEGWQALLDQIVAEDDAESELLAIVEHASDARLIDRLCHSRLAPVRERAIARRVDFVEHKGVILFPGEPATFTRYLVEFLKLVAGFACDVTVEGAYGPVNAKSPSGMLGLGNPYEGSLTITCRGKDAQQAFATIESWANRGQRRQPQAGSVTGSEP